MLFFFVSLIFWYFNFLKFMSFRIMQYQFCLTCDVLQQHSNFYMSVCERSDLLVLEAGPLELLRVWHVQTEGRTTISRVKSKLCIKLTSALLLIEWIDLPFIEISLYFFKKALTCYLSNILYFLIICHICRKEILTSYLGLIYFLVV